MLKELSTTIATDFGSVVFTGEKENKAGFENTSTSITNTKDRRKSRRRSFILDFRADWPWEESSKDTAEKPFLTPLFLDIKCAMMGRRTAESPIRKSGFNKEKFNFASICPQFG